MSNSPQYRTLHRPDHDGTPQHGFEQISFAGDGLGGRTIRRKAFGTDDQRLVRRQFRGLAQESIGSPFAILGLRSRIFNP